jgi:hypothetical protein
MQFKHIDIFEYFETANNIWGAEIFAVQIGRHGDSREEMGGFK